MGLDITAYRNLILAPDAPPYGEWKGEDFDRYLRFYENSSFPGSMAGMAQNAVFKKPETDADVLKFRGGSYSGYNWWRDHLCIMAHGFSARLFWNLSERKRAEPAAFRELINFSDCEGTIGPVIAAKLAKDFADFQEKADAYKTGDDSDEWWHEAYASWRKAFEMAAQNGAVDFC